MTPEPKEAITSLQQSGLGYKSVASKLSLSVNTVKSYCRRQKVGLDIGTERIASDFCPVCGKSLTHYLGKKKKKYYSDRCRMSWWNQHQDQVNRQTYQLNRCLSCDCLFRSYGCQARKYCSRRCYFNHRYGGGEYED